MFEKTPQMRPSRRAQRRHFVAVVSLSAMMVALFLIPSSALFVAGFAPLLILVGAWDKARETRALQNTSRKEPCLWDDGFGAT